MTLATHAELSDIVLDGSRAQQGMPDFEGVITNEELESIRAFVVYQARQLQQFQQNQR